MRGNNMKHCNKCTMPDTRPGMEINEDGICLACQHYENRKNVDYKKRWTELENICNKYRKNDGQYDCLIAVSGGKDSYFQVHTFKNILKMNPLLVCVNAMFNTTESGRKNFKNLSETFGCDIVSLTLNQDVEKRMTRIGFEELGRSAYPFDLAIYVFPVRMAINFDIPLLIYGENVSYEYGGVQEHLGETYSAKEQIYNTVASPLDEDFWVSKGFTKNELSPFYYPNEEEIENAKLDPIYLSYFTPWDSYKNYRIAKENGFVELPDGEHRQGTVENWNQIDSIGYLVDEWLKYPKQGYTITTAISSRFIRYGMLTRDEAVDLVLAEEFKLDDRVLEDFLLCTGYSKKEFYQILEDKYWNRDLFEKKNGYWVIKEECKIRKTGN